MSSNAPRDIALLSKFTPKPRRLDRLAKRMLIQRLEKLEHGTIKIVEDNQTMQFGHDAPGSSLDKIAVTLFVKDSQFYGEVVFGGSIGACEAYIQGYFE
jgi:cyclopropane-fatty-acyl-phospholipid synthase